ncbi:hypothetical protein BDV41DRAFT_547385 [Aspergillus transmontanensis]|uniref:Uncharacterized protein n=1 Tax=Aspergillus transmontanensis TaxID=1034304 RepID=A0A5N6VNC9_9EURO|nr:hypothetical protein BDV41DRAFT_547385 [Aspergillus transmontanensis]
MRILEPAGMNQWADQVPRKDVCLTSWRILCLILHPGGLWFWVLCFWLGELWMFFVYGLMCLMKGVLDTS